MKQDFSQVSAEWLNILGVTVDDTDFEKSLFTLLCDRNKINVSQLIELRRKYNHAFERYNQTAPSDDCRQVAILYSHRSNNFDSIIGVGSNVPGSNVPKAHDLNPKIFSWPWYISKGSQHVYVFRYGAYVNFCIGRVFGSLAEALQAAKCVADVFDYGPGWSIEKYPIREYSENEIRGLRDCNSIPATIIAGSGKDHVLVKFPEIKSELSVQDILRHICSPNHYSSLQKMWKTNHCWANVENLVGVL